MGGTEKEFQDQRSKAERIMKEDHEILRALAAFDRGDHNVDANSFERQMEAARWIMRERRDALRMLAEYDKGLPDSD